MLTGNRNTDMEIMQQLEDNDLVNLCQTNRYSRNLCQNEIFWMNRVLRKFPDLDLEIAKQYKKNRTWANYYIKDLRKVTGSDDMLIENSKKGRLDRVIVGIEKGANIHAVNNAPLSWAIDDGHLPVVKYLVNHGANIHAADDDALRWASLRGHLPVIKFLIEKGANIHAVDDLALGLASEAGHLEVVKYLVEKGANIHAADDRALKWAREEGYTDVVEYLESLD